MEFVNQCNAPMIEALFKTQRELASIRTVVKAAVNDRDEMAGKLRAIEQGVDVKWKTVRHLLRSSNTSALPVAVP